MDKCAYAYRFLLLLKCDSKLNTAPIVKYMLALELRWDFVTKTLMAA